MAVIHIGIELKDSDFAIALARGISRQGGDFQIHLENPRECDVLLTDRPGSEKKNDGKVILLTEKRPGAQDSPYSSYKFEDSREIMRKIICIANKDMEGEADLATTSAEASCRTRGKMKVIGFFGSGGGCGVTSSMLAISKSIEAGFGKRTLYLNMQSLDTSWDYFRDSSGKNSQELFFALEEMKFFNLSKFIIPGSPDRIVRGRIDNFMESASCGDIEKLICTVDKADKYDYLFIDFGCDFSKRNREAAKIADCMILEKNSGMGDHFSGAEELTAYFRSMGGTLMKIHNRSAYDCQDYEMSQQVPCDRDAFMGGDCGIAINLNSDYGKGIANFVYKFERVIST